MNRYSENKTVESYDRKEICSCGAKADHIPAGLCWKCFDNHSASLTRLQRKELYARLEEMGLGIKPNETREEWNQRTRDWCQTHSPLLGRYAQNFSKRKSEIRQSAILAGVIEE